MLLVLLGSRPIPATSRVILVCRPRRSSLGAHRPRAAYQTGYLSNYVPVPGGIGVLDGSMIGILAIYRSGGTMVKAATPTSVYAAPQDCGCTELGTRIELAVTELTVMVRAGVEQHVADDAWSSYKHEFAGNAARAAAQRRLILLPFVR